MLGLYTLVVLLALVSSEDVGPRIDCHPEPNASQEECEKRSCRWVIGDSEKNEPFCIYGENTGYVLVGDAGTSPSDFRIRKSENSKNPYYSNVNELQIKTKRYGATFNVKIFDPNNERYEVPLPLPAGSSSPDTDFDFIVNSSAPGNTFAFTLVVHRSSGNVNLWDTSIGGLLFGDQYIQIATYLPTKNIYGFGEHIHKKIRHNMDRYTTWPMFTRDIGPDSGHDLSTLNLYGVHPFYMAVEDGGNAHGVFILNSNAQEVTLGPGPHLVYKTIGGILDIYFFPGPTPEQVVQQYEAFIGTPMLPSYWALGFQLCRWGYKNLTDMEEAVERTQKHGVPLEIVIADIDYMDGYADFTLGWEGLKEYTDKLHKNGLHLTLITDAGIPINNPSFQRGLELKARFIEWPNMTFVDETLWEKYPSIVNTTIMAGNVWPSDNTAMPDFLEPTKNTENWWIDEFKRLRNLTGMDSIWLDMNEPSNFDTDAKNNVEPARATSHLRCPINGDVSKYDNPKYPTFAKWNHGTDTWLFSKTLCMFAKTGGGKYNFYDTHSIYATTQAMATYNAQKAFGTRGAVISRSSYPSLGHYVGHWLGDNTARWEDLQTSVIGAQEFNMFGVTYIGSDICGFNGNTTEELCIRWHQMGAFHTYSRNHNSIGQIPQDPGQWETVAQAAKISLLFKYTYLPYLYTLMYEANRNGGTVIRPMFFEFPKDPNTYDIGYQFMWGSGMMFMPVVFPNQTTVTGYIPNAEWFSLREDDYGAKIEHVNSTATFSAGRDEVIPVFARGKLYVLVKNPYVRCFRRWSIIPKQQPATVIRDMRNNPFELLIVPESGTARGYLFWDDGDSYLDNNFYHFMLGYNDNGVLAKLSFVCFDNPTKPLFLPPLKTIEVFDYLCNQSITQITVVRTEGALELHDVNITYSENHVFRIDIAEPINITDLKDITWQRCPVTTTATPPTTVSKSTKSTDSTRKKTTTETKTTTKSTTTTAKNIPDTTENTHTSTEAPKPTVPGEGPRIDCYPEPDALREACQERGCIWIEGNSSKNEPWCIYGSNTGYLFPDGYPQNTENFRLKVNPKAKNPYYPNLEELQVQAKQYGATFNVKIFDPTNKRQSAFYHSLRAKLKYEVPLPLPKHSSTPDTNYDFIVDDSAPNNMFAFSVIVHRSTGNVKLWDTSIGGLLFGDQYIQIATYLPTKNVYGFGEHIHKRIRHNMDRYTTWPMFTRDIGPDSGHDLSTLNLYGVHPFYMAIEDGGNAHGVFILNSNAQEVTLGPGPHLVYRTIGGILDIYFFPGPSPEQVVQQYEAFIGTPMLPSYWALGFQLCRWGYKNLTDMEEAVERTQKHGVPLEIVIADIDYMIGHSDFTLGWEGLKEYTDYLHSQGLHLTLITDAAIPLNWDSFNRAIAQNASFIEWPDLSLADQTIWNWYPSIRDTKIMVGNVWPVDSTVMPDFLDLTGNTEKWWIGEFERLRNITGMDSVWLDMNEPSNFDTYPRNSTQSAKFNYHLSCPITGDASRYDNPEYATFARWNYGNDAWLFSKTLCMIGKTGRGEYNFYDTHSIYATTQAMATYNAQKAFGTRGAVISRSSFPSIGHYVGHWLGDNTARWEDLQTSVIGAQEFNMFGVTYIGSDICGFNGNTTEELCIRWHQMGAFHTYSRNHNSIGQIPQDPGQWETVAQAAKISLLFKYTYLPYLYTLMYEANRNGGTVIRPMFFEFPKDPNTYDIGYQFMWGSGMMFMPVVFPNQTTVTGYIPNAEWFSLREDDYGAKITKVNTIATFRALYDEVIPVFARGSNIISKQIPETVIRDMRRNAFTFLVVPESGRARGHLFWDDGDSYLSNNFYYLGLEFNTFGENAMLQIVRYTEPTNDVFIPSLTSVEVMNYPCLPAITEVTVILNRSVVQTRSLTTVYLNENKMFAMQFTEPLKLTELEKLSWVMCSNVTTSTMPTLSTTPTLTTSTTSFTTLPTTPSKTLTTSTTTKSSTSSTSQITSTTTTTITTLNPISSTISNRPPTTGSSTSTKAETTTSSARRTTVCGTSLKYVLLGVLFISGHISFRVVQELN